MKTARALALFLLLASPLTGYSAEKIRLEDVPEKPVKPTKAEIEAEKKSADMTPEERKKLLFNLAEESYKKGKEALAEGNKTGARAFFVRTLALHPGHQDAMDHISRIDRSLKKSKPPPKKTVEMKSKKSAETRLIEEFNRTLSHDNTQAAVAIGEKILAADPSNARVKQKMAELREKMFWDFTARAKEREKKGEIRGAVSAYQAALRIRNDAAVAEKIKDLKQIIYVEDSKKSQELYLKALESNQAGNIKQALSQCRRALELDPDNLQAQRMLQRLKTMRH